MLVSVIVEEPNENRKEEEEGNEGVLDMLGTVDVVEAPKANENAVLSLLGVVVAFVS